MNKVWEKDYFAYMKGSEFIAVLCSGNYKVSSCYEVLLKGMAYPIYARDVGEIFFSGFIFAKFVNKVWEKDYFGYMKGSKFIAVLFCWNYKVRNCYELLLQGRRHPIYAREVF